MCASRFDSTESRSAKRRTCSGFVRGVLERLGEEAHGRDGGLQLVADVRDEVAAHLVEAVRLGTVVGEQQHEARAEPGDPHREPHRRVAEGPARQLELDRDRPRRAAHGRDEVDELVVREHLVAHEAHRERSRRRPQHVVRRVEHDAGRFEHVEHLVDPVGDGGGDHACRALAATLGHVQHDREPGSEQDAEGQRGQHRPGGVHGTTLTTAHAADPPGGPPGAVGWGVFNSTAPAVHLRRRGCREPVRAGGSRVPGAGSFRPKGSDIHA